MIISNCIELQKKNIKRLEDQFNDMKYGHVLLENLMYYWDKSFAVLQNAKIDVRPCKKRPYEEIFRSYFQTCKGCFKGLFGAKKKNQNLFTSNNNFLTSQLLIFNRIIGIHMGKVCNWGISTQISIHKPTQYTRLLHMYN